jgi:hypothetical protein
MMRSRVAMGFTVAAAVTAGAVGGALIGVPGLSGAQPFPKDALTTATADGSKPADAPRRESALLDAAAKALKLTTQQLTDKLSDGKTTIADVAKQQNVDINTVIDAMAAADKARIGDIVNKPWPKFGPHGPGKGGLGGPGFGIGLGRIGGIVLEPVAKALGISTDELKTDLAKGQSIADIAKAKNVDLNKVIDALVADATAKIDQAVKDGHFPAAMADKLKSTLKEMITSAVNGSLPKFPKLPDGGWGDHGPRRVGKPGMWGGSEAPSSTTPTTKPAAA